MDKSGGMRMGQGARQGISGMEIKALSALSPQDEREIRELSFNALDTFVDQNTEVLNKQTDDLVEDMRQAGSHTQILIARDLNGVVGCIAFTTHGGVAEVKSIRTARQRENTEVLKELLGGAEAHARQAGCAKLTIAALHANEELAWACHLEHFTNENIPNEGREGEMVGERYVKGLAALH